MGRRSTKEFRWLGLMFVVCVPIILWTYLVRPNAITVVQFQILVLFGGTIAGALVWYFFGEIIVEGATHIYETIRGRDHEERQPTRTYEELSQQEIKYCISCGPEIPRRARFCRECRAEQ